MNIKISPSLMCADMLHLGEQLAILENKANFLHIDIIDWHYVKNFCLAPQIMDQIRKVSSIPMDAHLMVDNVDTDLMELCLDCGADSIEVDPMVARTKMFRFIDLVKKRGKKIGVYINPADPLEITFSYIHLLDRITFMSVDPGYAGQRFVRETLDKIREAKRLKLEKGYTFEIEIDGSCNRNTYKEIYDAGTEIFILGSSGLFGLDNDLEKAWAMMTRHIEETIG